MEINLSAVEGTNHVSVQNLHMIHSIKKSIVDYHSVKFVSNNLFFGLKAQSYCLIMSHCHVKPFRKNHARKFLQNGVGHG